MIITKTHIDKVNTLVKGSPVNLSLNPVMELNYGKMLTRTILYFDHTKLKELVDSKVYPDMGKLRHVLKFTNAASITDRHINKPCLTSEYDGKKERAISFDLVFFLLPNQWDDGRGFDYVWDLYEGAHRSLSTDGSNWYQYKNYYRWGKEGVYSLDDMMKEYDLFTSKEGNLSNVIIAKQHFEYGNEDINVDITDTVNKFITGELENNGIGIAFAPYYENTVTEKPQYVGFFTQRTNSFYKPWLETTYDEYIEDDRNNFFLDKENKLYFYSTVNGSNVNLDELPTCTVNGNIMEVRQATRGIYYINLSLPSDENESDVMMHDVWSNIRYNGRAFKDVELDFVTKLPEEYYSFGLPSGTSRKKEIIPSIYGINDREEIKSGDIRKVRVDCKIPYSSEKCYDIEELYYRLYVHEGGKQVDIVGWTLLERGFNENYFYVNTYELVPFRYHIDIKYCNGTEIKNHNNIVEFDVINDVTVKYN